MRVVLLSNVAHYYHLAAALAETGRLRRFITSIALRPGERLPAWLPASLSAKLEGRRLPASISRRTTRFLIPEVLQQLLMRAPPRLAARSDWIQDPLFGALALPFVGDADVLHFVNGVGLFAARRARRLGMLTVCDVRQEHPVFHQELLSDEHRRLGLAGSPHRPVNQPRLVAEYGLADLIVAPSEFARRTYVQRGLPADRVVSLPLGVDLEHFHRVGHEVDAAVFRVLFVGQITPRKGVQYLLEAVRTLGLPDLELVLIGQVDPRLRPLLGQYQGEFIHIPSVPKIQLTQWYSRSDVFVLPSLADAFGLVVLEAMACGTPVVVTENVGAAEAVREGEAGYIVPIRSVEALSERIRYLYTHRLRAREMGFAAAQVAQQRTWLRYARQVDGIYTALDNRFNQREA